MRYLSHARPVVRDLSSVCPTVRLPTLSHLPHQRSTPRSATTTPHSPTTSTAATRSSAWSSSPSSSSSVSTPARARSRRPSESSRACTRNQPCHVVDHGCPAALRQASCRHGSGGRGAETIYSNNGPRVIREALDFPIFKNASRAFSPLQTCARATPGERRRMRVRLPSSTIEDGLPSPSKSKPARASLLHRLLNKHIILLLMLALTVRCSSHTCKCAPS